MAKYRGFYTGNDPKESDAEVTGFSRVRQPSSSATQNTSKEGRVWADDFAKCSSKEDFEQYIRRYKKYSSNTYVKRAKQKLDEFAAKEEKSRIDEMKARERMDHVSADTPQINHTPKNLTQILRVAIWAIVFVTVAVGVNAFREYVKEQMKPPIPPIPSEDVIIVTDDDDDESQPQDPEPQIIEYDCDCCDTTGKCHLCFGNRSCGVCGGCGLVYSVFYGDEVGPGRLTDCGNCGGTGRCPACDGSGSCFACNGRGKVTVEY